MDVKEPFIKLEEYCTDIKECYAHISTSKLFTDNQKTQNYETIEEHIKNVKNIGIIFLMTNVCCP